LNKKLKLGLIWAAPFGLFIAYLVLSYALRIVFPHIKGLPSTRTIEGAAAVEILASPLWVFLAISMEYIFGGKVIVYFIKLLSNSKLLKRKFVLSARKGSIEEIAEEKQVPKTTIDQFSYRSFGIALGLAMGLNVAYTLLIVRSYAYNAPGHGVKLVGSYLLLPQFILIDFGVAILFLPLIEIVMPLFLGRIRIRQVDGFPTEYFWLGYVYSAAGGLSLVMFFLSFFEGKTGDRSFIIATLFVYILISWYTALGSVMGEAFAEKKLAQELVKLKGKKNIYFGYIFVGKDRLEAEQV
jgi:hypothetical protein